MLLQPTKDHLQMNEFRQHKYSVLIQGNPVERGLMLFKIEGEAKPSSMMHQCMLCSSYFFMGPQAQTSREACGLNSISREQKYLKYMIQVDLIAGLESRCARHLKNEQEP